MINMEIEVFRKVRSKGLGIRNSKLLIKLEIPRGQIIIFKNSMDLMGFKYNESVMFGFNRKNKCGFIFKEEAEDDSYYLRNSNRTYSRFTSKNLMLHMCDVFEITGKNKAYFELEKEANEKGMYKFTLIK